MDVAKINAPAPQLSAGANGMREIEYVSRTWGADVPATVTKEQLLAPDFWAHHAQSLSPWDEIKARSADGTWYAHLLVLDVSRVWAKVTLLHYYTLGTKDVSMTQASNLEVSTALTKYEVKHRGPRKWSVVRTADQAVVFEDGAQKEDAVLAARAIATKEVRGSTPITA